MRIYIVFVLFLMISIKSYSQKVVGLTPIGFAELNLTNNAITILDSSVSFSGTIQGFSTFDETNGRYIYSKFGAFPHPDTIVIMHAESGNIVFKDTIPPDYFYNPEFCQSNNKIYGISPGGFTELNISNSMYTILNTSINPDNVKQGCSTFDQTNGRYFYTKVGTGFPNPDTIVMIDAFTGNIVIKYIVPENYFYNPEYYQGNNRIYGLTPFGFAELNLINNTYTILNSSLSDVNAVQGFSSFDQTNGRYVYSKTGNFPSPDTIIIIDAVSGNINQKDTIPQSYFYNPEYFKVNYVSTDDISPDADYSCIYPNPTEGMINVTANSEINIIELFNFQGEMIKRMKVFSKQINISITDLEMGSYYLRIYTAKTSKVWKVIKL